jgi:hypothetical protein
MIEFEIYFHGLICFYAPEARLGARDYKTEALMVDDADHTRKIKTYNSEVVNLNTISTNLDAGRVNAQDGAFQTYVPHLSDGAVTRPHVVVDPAKAIRLALPDGAATVADLYKYNGIYALDGMTTVHPACRISLVRVQADKLVIHTDVGDVQVPPDRPWVAILNYSINGGTGLANNHFHRYARITNGRISDVAEVTDDSNEVPNIPDGRYVNEVKDLPELKNVPVVSQTQCSNTNWP